MVKRNFYRSLMAIILVTAFAVTSFVTLNSSSQASSSPNNRLDIYKDRVPNIDVNSTAAVTRQPNALQQQSLNQFKMVYGNQASARWNNFAGSPDVMMGFHTPVFGIYG